MTVEAMAAVWALAPELDKLLADVPAKRRPSKERALLVALRLADKFHRGYVDETLGQLRDVLPFDDVGTVLQALDKVGMWVPASGAHGGGRQSAGTRRVPGRLLELRGADPAKNSDVLRGVDPGTPRGEGRNSAGLTPLHHHPPVGDPTTSSSFPPAGGSPPDPLVLRSAAQRERVTSSANCNELAVRDVTQQGPF